MEEHLICGIDEAGRGALCGPLFAAAVILDPTKPITGLQDSKQLTKEKREILFDHILDRALCFCIAHICEKEIDHLGIHKANLLVMKKAWEGLALKPETTLVDGKFTPDIIHCQAIIKGDTKIPSIQAASILAKVSRDRWMTDYAQKEPQYAFEQHKGYPTVLHKEKIRLYGPSQIQRFSFNYL